MWDVNKGNPNTQKRTLFCKNHEIGSDFLNKFYDFTPQ